MNILKKYKQSATSLDLSNHGITSIQGLEKFIHLKRLNLRGNKIKSLEPLQSLHKLKKLNIRNNQIKSIQPIVHLPLTDRLYLRGNDIDDLKLLENKLQSINQTDFIIGTPKPSFSFKSGVYNEPFLLELETDVGHEIYYTLDGSIPNTNSHKYEGPIEISEEVMLRQPIISNYKTSPLRDGFNFDAKDVKRAITVTTVAYIDGSYSLPNYATYILASNTNLPTIALSMDPKDLFDKQAGMYVPGATYKQGDHGTGNYYHRGRKNEKRGFIEFFHKDGTVEFNQRVGIRINGSFTRRFPQKSLRIYARSSYGQNRMYTDVFKGLPYNEFKLLVLRNSGDDYQSTLLRDGLMHELVKDLPVDVQAYEPAIVLLNGEYWGIHNIREKFNKDYIRFKYTIRKRDIVLMKVNKQSGTGFDLKAGTTKDKAHYDKILAYVDKDKLTDAHINQIETFMDIDNYLHYVAYQVYYANTDSFSNNLMLWRKRTSFTPQAPHGHDGRWRWMLYDLDWGMGYGLLNIAGDPLTYNMIEHVLKNEERMKLFRGLMTNEQVKKRFIQTMMTLLNTHFTPKRVQKKITELASAIRPEIPNSIARWENIESIEKWEENIRILHEFAERRPEIVRRHMMEEFGIKNYE